MGDIFIHPKTHVQVVEISPPHPWLFSPITKLETFFLYNLLQPNSLSSHLMPPGYGFQPHKQGCFECYNKIIATGVNQNMSALEWGFLGHINIAIRSRSQISIKSLITWATCDFQVDIVIVKNVQSGCFFLGRDVPKHNTRLRITPYPIVRSIGLVWENHLRGIWQGLSRSCIKAYVTAVRNQG